MLPLLQNRLPRYMKSRGCTQTSLLIAILLMITIHSFNIELVKPKNGEKYSNRQLLVDKTKSANAQIRDALLSREYCKPYYEDLQRQFMTHVDITNIVNDRKIFIPNDTTLLTHLPASQLIDLYGFIMGWQGYISASVYIAEDDISHIKYDVISSMKSLNRTNVQIHFIEQQGIYYPTNYLRNVAQDHALTQYVLYLDVDFRPMRDMQMIMSEYIPYLFATYATGGALAVAMPAIATSSIIDYPVRKKEAKETWGENVFAFDHSYPNGVHFQQVDRIDHDKWLRRKGAYPVKYHAQWTPFYLLDKSTAPRYNEYFVEHIYDRISHAIEVSFDCPSYRVFAPGFFVRKPPFLQKKGNKTVAIRKFDDLVECSRMVFDLKYGSFSKSLRRNTNC